jgi:uncharacterized protein (TIGR03118 family)
MRKASIVYVALVAAGSVGLTACSGSSSPATSATAAAAAGKAAANNNGVISVRLNSGGCNPGQLAIPAGKSVLQVTNDAAVGEFEIRGADDSTLARIPTIRQNQSVQLPVNLPTGYYGVECRTEGQMTTLTAGDPKIAPVDLGSAQAPSPPAPPGYGTADGNKYTKTVLVASSDAYNPQIVDPTLVDAWGLAIRPKGDGGHFWVGSNKTGNSLEYVGDVKSKPLNQEDLRTVSVPGAFDPDHGAPKAASMLGQPTGIIFNPYTTRFKVDQGPITGAAKFLFAGSDGTISAWTEKPQSNGTTTQLAWATKVVDASASGQQFFGLAIAPGGQRLLAADFGIKPAIRTFNSNFKPMKTTGFANPFSHGPVKVGSIEPWNVTTIGDKVYICYATVGNTAEEQHAAGYGKIAEFTASGKLVRVLADKGSLDAPWGITTAPPGFGKLTGDLLVANFGDGTVSAFDSNGTFVDYLRGPDGKPLVNPGIWTILPGNGSSLGAADAVYFTAGPRAEQDGLFGRINAEK